MSKYRYPPKDSCGYCWQPVKEGAAYCGDRCRELHAEHVKRFKR
jgi:predicted nucleic acid-binding Zn ribbon protein